MKIVIVANHYSVCSARYMTDAFIRLGHEVRHIGPAMGSQIWGLSLPEQYVWTPETELWATEEKPGYNLYLIMDSDPEILNSIRPTYPDLFNLPMAVYGVDNHVRNYRRAYFDHYFLAHRHASVMDWIAKDAAYFPAGELVPETIDFPMPDMTWLPVGYDPVMFTPSPIPWHEREYDVACLGVMYPRRKEIVKALIDAGLKVAWGAGLVYEAYRDVYHNSRISLCVSAVGDLAQRVFETAAMGCAILTDPLHDLMHNDTGEALGLAGFAVYGNTEQAAAIAKELLQDPPRGLVNNAAPEDVLFAVGGAPDVTMGEFGARLMQKAAKRHTWDARAQTIVEWYGGKYGQAQ